MRVSLFFVSTLFIFRHALKKPRSRLRKLGEGKVFCNRLILKARAGRDRSYGLKPETT